MAVLRPCSVPGCKALSKEGGRCAEHRRERWQSQEQQRGNEHRMGHSDRRWRKARQQYLSSNPLCADPFKKHKGQLKVATVLDHIKPHRGDFVRCWDPANWQGLCKSCNDRKTAIDHGWTEKW